MTGGPDISVPMYEIRCETCGRVGFHPSRTGAEIKANSHFEQLDHDGTIQEMSRALRE